MYSWLTACTAGQSCHCQLWWLHALLARGVTASCGDMQAYDDNQTQMTLDSFLSFSQRFAKIKSRRLQKAVAGITGGPSLPSPSQQPFF